MLYIIQLSLQTRLRQGETEGEGRRRKRLTADLKGFLLCLNVEKLCFTHVLTVCTHTHYGSFVTSCFGGIKCPVRLRLNCNYVHSLDAISRSTFQFVQ